MNMRWRKATALKVTGVGKEREGAREMRSVLHVASRSKWERPTSFQELRTLTRNDMQSFYFYSLSKGIVRKKDAFLPCVKKALETLAMFSREF